MSFSRTTTDAQIIESIPAEVRRLMLDLHTYDKYQGAASTPHAKLTAEKMGLVSVIWNESNPQLDIVNLTKRGNRIANKIN